MELLSNLTWLIVALFLWGAWLWKRRHGRAASRLPGIGAQLIALGVLTALLLPAISITDDLQASHNPAEVERSTASRNDHHLVTEALQPSFPTALALFAVSAMPDLSSQIAFLSSADSVPRPMDGYLRSLESRPPPTA